MPRTAAGAVPKFSPPGAACIIAKFDFGKMKLNLGKPHIPEIFGKDIISPLKLRCNGGGLRDIRRAFPDAPPVPIAQKTFGSAYANRRTPDLRLPLRGRGCRPA